MFCVQMVQTVPEWSKRSVDRSANRPRRRNGPVRTGPAGTVCFEGEERRNGPTWFWTDRR